MSLARFPCATMRLFDILYCSWQGSNLRLWAHKTHTLTTELQELFRFPLHLTYYLMQIFLYPNCIMTFSNLNKLFLEICMYIAAFGLADYYVDLYNIPRPQFYLCLFFISIFLWNRLPKK